MDRMGQWHAQLLASLRQEVLEKLVEIRGTLDHAYARLSEAVVRPQFDAVLDKMQSYLATDDPQVFRGFAASHMAMRVGEGFAPENLVHTVVAIGDVVSKVAQHRLSQDPRCADFVLACTRMSFVAARTMVSQLADDVKRREAQRDQVVRRGRGS
jgi:hypothetical protein